MIKKLILALIMLPAVTVCAQERPDGLLGTDFFMASANYSNVDMGYYANGLDLDYVGTSLCLNKHIADGSSVGFDTSFVYSYATNANNRSGYSDDVNDFRLLFTLYRINDNFFTPYLSVIAGYEKEKFKNKVSKYSDNLDTTYFGGEAGVEVHLLEGLSFVPYVDYLMPTSDDFEKQTTIGASLNYWFTSSIGANVDVNYSTNDHIDTISMSAGLAFHF